MSWKSIKTVGRQAGAIAVATAALVTAYASPALAADFSGKRVELIMPFQEGGGTDTWGRFWVPHLSKHLPGNPSVVVRNIPGGGSTTGANQFEARARPDGLTLLGTSASTHFPYLLNDRRVRFEAKDWEVILGSPTGGVVFVRPELGVQSAADMGKLRGQSLKYGSQGATSLDLVPLLAFDIMGLNVDAVFGMQGRGAGRLAFERGEVNIDYQTSSAYINNVKPLIEANQAVPLFSWGMLDSNGNIVRDPSFPDLPSFPEAYEMAFGEKPSGPAWEAYKSFFIAGFPAQKMLVLPKGTPSEIVEAYRAAATAAINDPAFQENREAALGEYEQVVGKPAEVMMEQAFSVSEESRNWVRNWLTEKYSVQF
ncbi:tripartite tricarboxylate transporter substrate binding protein [Telmatospirillum sp. J64-1]|uniref:Bug family tripartite tricarboxylate transporter substrate binding protein n=1 Tax=Telmatospirillum sp. J64-1 TaxID=2502183 RepID=UPI00115ECE46|nr:tricarboxylate transporter [Telmatospirillum sp. J64-1]